MARSPQTYGWEDFKPREDGEGTPTGRQLFSYDGEIRVDCKRRSSGAYEDWLFITARQRDGTWTRLCLDTSCTLIAQGFGRTRKAASQQLKESLHARDIAAYRALEGEDQPTERSRA